MRFPPLVDKYAQRWWLGGFGTAWAAGFEEEGLLDALARPLAGSGELLLQLRSSTSAEGFWALP